MKRIFLTLAVLSTLVLGVAFALGWVIDDPRSPESAVQDQISFHFLTALAALVFATLVHALVLTYFMGTGRWMEETSNAYHLPDDWRQQSQKLKYRTLPAMSVCLLMLILTGAFGAAADPASAVGFQGWFGLSAGTIHMIIAATTLTLNVFVNLLEYQALDRNSQIVDQVVREVRRMREERGLPV